jgi:hypothetical protein
VFRRDYIIRLIEEFGVLWARLVEQMRGGNIPAARLTLDQAYQRLLGMTPADVHAMPIGHLVARISLGAPPDDARSQCWILCALLRSEGDLAAAAGMGAAAAQHYQRALDLLLATGPRPGEELPAYLPMADDLRALVARSHDEP